MQEEFKLKQIELQYQYENKKEMNKLNNNLIQENIKNKFQIRVDKLEKEKKRLENEHEINMRKMLWIKN